jgi:hypothetical protein
VEKLIKSLGDEYRGDRYHLTSKNCNHFTAELAKILTGMEAPGWINRLATLSGSLPFFERWIPQEWLTPMALEDSIDDSAQTNGNAKNGSTLNYPTSSVDKAAEAVKVCGSPSSRQKPINGK